MMMMMMMMMMMINLIKYWSLQLSKPRHRLSQVSN